MRALLLDKAQRQGPSDEVNIRINVVRFCGEKDRKLLKHAPLG
ncbi:hypothetical protein [Hominenteromicrobium sp.]